MNFFVTMRMFLLAFPRNSGQLFSTTSIGGNCPANLKLSLSRTAINSDNSRCKFDDRRQHQRVFVLPKDSALENGNKNKNWLVVGDGDLSYSAMIAGQLANKNISLFATVLEEESIHDRVYKRSKYNKEAILANGSKGAENPNKTSSQHQVLFGIDATKLEHIFTDTKFQTIEFNFPHWKGKTNARRNRQLLDSFLGSACRVLSSNGGEIVISLCDGQGGFPASTGTYVCMIFDFVFSGEERVPFRSTMLEILSKYYVR